MQPGDPNEGDFVRLGNHPFVLAKPLKVRRYKPHLTDGMVCLYGKDYKYDYTGFDKWPEEDNQQQMEFVKANMQSWLSICSQSRHYLKLLMG